MYILNEIRCLLQWKNQIIDQLITDMNQRINNVWTKREREYIDACFAYERYHAELLIKPYKKKTLMKIEEEATRYVRALLGEEDGKTLDEMMKLMYALADKNLNEIKIFKEELLRAMKPYAYHVNSINGLSELKASKRKENMYCNEVVDGVFALTSYDQLILYMGRAVAGGMHVLRNGDICIYSKNPVESIIKEQVVLKKDVCMYSVLLDEFEPVIDYVLNEGRAEILFDHEWISKKDRVACNGIVLRTMPLEDWNRHRFFYNSGVEDEITLGDVYRQKMSVDRLNEVLLMMVEEGKLGQILAERE